MPRPVAATARVVAVERSAHGGDLLVLQPTTAAELDGRRVVVRGAARAGDWVTVLLDDEPAPTDGATFVARELTVIASSVGEFPRPGGEWYRLREHGGRRVENLRARARALAALRAEFAGEDFLEIDAPLLVPSPGLELHLDAFAVENRYLITSPEYQLKRLLAAGLSRVYAVTRCFRRGESGPHHNPEFTMVEWYRSPGRWEQIADDVERVCARVVERVTGAATITYQGQSIALGAPWERLPVREAVLRYAGVALDGDEPADDLARKARAAGYDVPDGLPWDDVFFSVFLEAVEPRLGQGRPTILFDWPAPLAALARRKPGDPRVVERFEAYAGGLELCNGFVELTDPVEQRRRFEADLAERRQRGLPLYPVDERFLRALEEGLPPCAGVALGFDRLVMLACDAASLREVSAFVTDEL